MNIVLICNNYGETFDGIGAYGKIISEILHKKNSVRIFSARCNPCESSFSRISKAGMTKSIFQSAKYVFRNKTSCVIIEYPFIEWNPLFLIPFVLLKIISHKQKVPIILSLHEYGRASFPRKIVTRYLVSNCDYLGVSNKQMQQDLFSCCPNIFIREIPSNISSRHTDPPKKDLNQYVFLGLVSKSKAFREMIEAWGHFNINGDKTLHIISSSYLESIDSIKGIRYHYNISSENIVEIMRKCAFSIIPIKPYIDEKNATLKTSYIAGCIPIGVFSKDIFDTFKIRIDISSLSVKSILKGLIDSQKINKEKVIKMSETAFIKGKVFSPENIAKMLEQKLQEICLEYNHIS